MGELALVRHGGDGRAAQLSDWARVDPLRNVRVQPRDGVFAEPPAFRELAGQLQTIDCQAISVTPLPSGVPSIRTNGKCGALSNLKKNAARTPSNVSAPNMKHTTRSRIASNTNTGRLRPRPRAGCGNLVSIWAVKTCRLSSRGSRMWETNGKQLAP